MTPDPLSAGRSRLEPEISPDAAGKPIIEIKDLTFAYNSEPVLKEINLSVGRGDFLALLGANGGGKTTLLKIILGLLKPSAGSARVFGLAPGASQGRIGYVPQQSTFRAGFPITALQAVLMGLCGKTRPGIRASREEIDAALAVLERVGAADAARVRMDLLSGGQRQRVYVARALISSPELLIFDEPTSSIDPKGKFCFFDLLQNLSREITILVVSHDLSVTSSGVNRLACLNRRLIYNPKPVLTQEMLALIYGAHDHQCPMGAYLNNISGRLGSERGGGK